MPFFMDYHKDLALSVEDVKKAHIADEAVQGKYGVIYHQFWVNEHDGTVFCLMEGPDQESCAAVHREAHGEVACSIVEVSVGFYEVFMGNRHRIDQGLVRYQDGAVDTGIRNILAADIHGVTTIRNSAEYRTLKSPVEAKEVAISHILTYGGREVDWLHDDTLVAVFDSSQRAVTCAVELKRKLRQRSSTADNNGWNIKFKLALTAGQPLTENGNLFSEAVTTARQLCSAANTNQLLISPRVSEYCNVRALVRKEDDVRMLTLPELDFISKLFSVSEANLSDEYFTIDRLSRNIGVSRPQLYRKVVSLTGKSPNEFIRDLRMDKALNLIRRRAGNISEIALEVGYTNPSYFARCFQLRYGCTPSRFAVEAV